MTPQRLATALARGWIAAGLVAPGQVRASDPLPQAREAFGRELAAQVFGDNRQRWQDGRQLASPTGTAPITVSSGKQHSVKMRFHCDREGRSIGVVDLSRSGIRRISRLALHPNGRELAIVAEEPVAQSPARQ